MDGDILMRHEEIPVHVQICFCPYEDTGYWSTISFPGLFTCKGLTSFKKSKNPPKHFRVLLGFFYFSNLTKPLSKMTI